MRIEINIQTKYVLVILLFMATASVIGLVAAYGGTVPATVGHTWGEMECTGCIINSNLADSSVTSAKIADGTITNADISATAAIAGSKVTGIVPSATNADTVDGMHATGIATWGNVCNPVWASTCSCCEYGTTIYCYYMGKELVAGGTPICLSTPNSQGSCGSKVCPIDYSCC